MFSGRQILVYLTIKYSGDWNRIYEAIKEKEIVDETTVQEKLEQYTGNYVTIIDDNYPEKLKKIYKPPFVLFYKGNLDYINNTNISIVGSDSSALNTYDLLTVMLRKTLHKYQEIMIASINDGPYENDIHSVYGKNRILVFNKGIQTFDNNANLIISEYPSNSRAKKTNTPWAYRILVGITNALLIPETKGKEDNLIAAGYALYLNKPLGVFDQPDEATKNLSKDGASIINDCNDLYKLLQQTPLSSGTIPVHK